MISKQFKKNVGRQEIQANPDAYNHSLGVPIGTEVLDSIGPTDPIQVGERFDFGGPTQPPGAHNYVGTRDIVPWLNLINVVTAICTGFRDIEFMDSSGQSPLGAHSFLGPTYQKALQDSFHNSGNSNE